ncbi:putative porin [uncultured Desulfobacter sp.]|uniref:putative porin n=1 Tax=uncultured Desulfobacter sp. TaxID=240139 RepID=UPI002AA5E75D|nr:putative porin [uncultured Desulfobacter sp.]
MECLKVLTVWKKKSIFVVLVLMVTGLHCSGVFAADIKKTDGFDSTEALIELMKEKGVINDAEAQGFLKRYKEQAVQTKQTITILPAENQEEYIKNVSKGMTEKLTKDLSDLKENYEFRSDDLIRKTIVLQREVERLEEMMTEEHKPMLQKSSWAQRIRFGGDIRLRHESTLFDENNATDIEDPSDPGTYLNTTNDRHRQRIRLRVSAKADLIDPGEVNVGKVTAGFRVATGSVDNPVSTNHTLGSASSSHSDIVLDRAYVDWTYKPEAEVWGGKIPQVSLTGGIMENPWMSTNLVWDSDLALEGVSVKLISDTNKSNNFSGFFTAGYFPLEESEWNQSDKYLLGGQIGFEHRPKYGWKYKIAAAYYDYYNVEGFPITSTTRTTADEQELARMAPKYMQKGNTVFDMDQTVDPNGTTYGLLADFKLLNITGAITNSLFYPICISLYGDWVKNLGYDADEMANKAGVSKSYIESISGDTGYQVGLKVGHLKPRQRWEWNLFVEYRYLESDAVIDAFTDSDFHIGGTNAKGFIFGGELGLYENVWLKARWMSANEIDDMQMLGDTQLDDLSVDTFQLDLNAEF